MGWACGTLQGSWRADPRSQYSTAACEVRAGDYLRYLSTYLSRPCSAVVGAATEVATRKLVGPIHLFETGHGAAFARAPVREGKCAPSDLRADTLVVCVRQCLILQKPVLVSIANALALVYAWLINFYLFNPCRHRHLHHCRHHHFHQPALSLALLEAMACPCAWRAPLAGPQCTCPCYSTGSAT